MSDFGVGGSFGGSGGGHWGDMRMIWQVATAPRQFVSTSKIVWSDQQPNPAVAVQEAYAVTGSLISGFPATVRLVGVAVSNPGVQIEWSGDTPGVHASFALAPPQVALLVRKEGGLRKYQGRMFLPAVNESLVDDLGYWTPASVTQWQNRLNAFRQALLTRNVRLFQKNGVEVTNLRAMPMVATQRRRLRR